MPYRYTPILRTKAGEALALERLNNTQKDRILPLFNVAEDPPASFVTRMAAAWAQREMGLDGLHNFNFSGSGAIYHGLFHALGQVGIRVLPATEMKAPANYLAVMHPLVGQYGQGLLVRIGLGDIGAISAWVSQQGWNAADVHLIIDAGHIAQIPAQVITSVVVNECNQHISPADGWRSITFAAASAPADFGALPLGMSDVARVEWTAWNAIYPQIQVPINFGDYGPVHPNLAEPPGYVMANATVSVKYAVDGHWIAIKGRPTSGAHGLPMSQQYHAHAQVLANDPRFGQVHNCWADGRVSQIANNTISSGNYARALVTLILKVQCAKNGSSDVSVSHAQALPVPMSARMDNLLEPHN